jgi:hypothetical protein
MQTQTKRTKVDASSTSPKKKNTKVLYMAVQPNKKIVRGIDQLPVFWKGKKAKDVAKQLNGKHVRVTLSW